MASTYRIKYFAGGISEVEDKINKFLASNKVGQVKKIHMNTAFIEGCYYSTSGYVVYEPKYPKY